ncbi:MAG: ABC transporter permease [Spirochaetia bacterium]|uniref:Ribose transport system permease protein RbsC n=2 Tax=root TaxID=1 RepID=A0A652ZXV5_9SPIR|nr:ABC transporter permease [Spirochaetia bacterium]MCE1208019.1 ABC transporter permease [Spirochaetia bacterium]NLX44750.1 ABC transporter permease [Treponema sp.]VBB40626.1 Ribose transport system permease protein RbsC [uncultured Spirochaetota bacterium]HOI22681.1 ABC transporter permease [Spirochaetales bacterium]
MRENAKYFVQKYGTIITLILLIVIFSITTETFLEPRNLLNIVAHISMLMIIATGLTVCMVPGDFDMSIGSVASLSGIFFSSLVVRNFPLIPSILVVLLMGAVFGLTAGLLVTKVRISAFIATLALGQVATGINFMYTRGQEVFGDFSKGFLSLGQGKTFSIIPNQVLIMIGIVFIFAFTMEKTKVGRYMYAIGGSIHASFLSGIKVNLYRIFGLMISGGLAAFTGCILASRLGSGQPTAGDSYLMDAIAAAYIGMTTIKTSRPNIIGTLIGVLFIGVIENGLVLIGVSYFFQYIAKGVIIILAVALSSRGSMVVEK